MFGGVPSKFETKKKTRKILIFFCQSGLGFFVSIFGPPLSHRGHSGSASNSDQSGHGIVGSSSGSSARDAGSFLVRVFSSGVAKGCQVWRDAVLGSPASPQGCISTGLFATYFGGFFFRAPPSGHN